MSADYDDLDTWADDDAELDEDDLDWRGARGADEDLDASPSADDELASYEDRMADERSFWSLFRAPDPTDA